MKRVLRILGVILLVIVVLLGIGVGIIFAQSNTKLNQVYEIPDLAEIDIPEDEDAIANGERLYVLYGCTFCHGDNGGGAIMTDDPVFGRLVGTNLTSGEGGVGGDYTSSADWVRALRHGVDADGRSYVIMPSHHINHITDAELGRLIAYIQTLEPVDNVLAESQLGPLGRALTLAENTNDLLPGALIDHENVDVWNDVEAGVSEEYGHYLTRTCMGCHAENLSGQAVPGEPVLASNITFHESGIADYSLDQFRTAMRNGVRPDGSVIDPSMPWNLYSQYNDDELEAMYIYLQSIEPLPYNTAVTEDNSILNR